MPSAGRVSASRAPLTHGGASDDKLCHSAREGARKILVILQGTGGDALRTGV